MLLATKINRISDCWYAHIFTFITHFDNNRPSTERRNNKEKYGITMNKMSKNKCQKSSVVIALASIQRTHTHTHQSNVENHRKVIHSLDVIKNSAFVRFYVFSAFSRQLFSMHVYICIYCFHTSSPLCAAIYLHTHMHASIENMILFCSLPHTICISIQYNHIRFPFPG